MREARVLSEEEILKLENVALSVDSAISASWTVEKLDLIATVRDQQQKNAVLCETLERIVEFTEDKYVHDIGCEALAKMNYQQNQSSPNATVGKS